MATLLRFLILATICGTSLACSCYPMTDRLKYCDADFAMKVKVSRNLRIPGGPDAQTFDAFYRVRIIHTPWKFPDGEPVPKRTRLYTASNSALCGVTLQKGTTYFVAGSFDSNSGKMKINGCSSIIRTTPVPTLFKTWKKNPPNCQETTSQMPPTMFYEYEG